MRLQIEGCNCSNTSLQVVEDLRLPVGRGLSYSPNLEPFDPVWKERRMKPMNGLPDYQCEMREVRYEHHAFTFFRDSCK